MQIKIEKERKIMSIYIIPDRENIEKSLSVAKKWNAYFEYNDFFLPDVLDNQEIVQQRIDFYKSLDRDRTFDTMHGAFLDVTIHSSDSLIREISIKRIRQSMDIASELGIRGVVFHTNIIPNFTQDYYYNQWLKENENFWSILLKEYPNLNVFIENMFDQTPDAIVALAEHMKDNLRFGLCYDYAHACVFGGDVDNWTARIAPYVKHMHINDNDLKKDLHQTIGEGKIDWKHFSDLMMKYHIESSVLIEIHSFEKQESSLEYMKKKRIYPLNESLS